MPAGVAHVLYPEATSQRCTAALLPDDDTIKLCRIQYLGDPDDWAFAIWQASSDSYADAALLDGSYTGHPSQALNTACTLYLTDTGNHVTNPSRTSAALH